MPLLITVHHTVTIVLCAELFVNYTRADTAFWIFRHAV